MNDKLPLKIYEMLGKVIKNDISRYTIIVHSPNSKGEGFLGEMCYVSLEDKDSEKKFHFIIKQAFLDDSIRSSQPIRDVFMNEIYFYVKIWPRLQKFQDRLLNKRVFDKFAKCFATDTGVKSEKIVFENLRYQGFETFDKRGTFDKEHMEYVFKQYGRFHGVSAAFRALHPQEFIDFSGGLKDTFAMWSDMKSFQDQIKTFHGLCIKSLIPGKDDKIIEKYRTYIDVGADIFSSSVKYESQYPVIVHGDCWSNNMMFKYDDRGNLEDLRLIDLQLVKAGSPAADLAYCFYSSGSKENFAELNHYLDVYYNSLSASIRAFGCNPDQLYPYEVLKEEWKQCYGLGFTMALMLWRMKLIHQSHLVDFTDVTTENEELLDKIIDAEYDEETFRIRVRDIIVHLFEHDFL